MPSTKLKIGKILLTLICTAIALFYIGMVLLSLLLWAGSDKGIELNDLPSVTLSLLGAIILVVGIRLWWTVALKSLEHLSKIQKRLFYLSFVTFVFFLLYFIEILL